MESSCWTNDCCNNATGGGIYMGLVYEMRVKLNYIFAISLIIKFLAQKAILK